MVQRQRTIRAAFTRQLCKRFATEALWIFAILHSGRQLQMKKDRWTALGNGVGLFRSGALGAARISCP
jgi:hypothetical protein